MDALYTITGTVVEGKKRGKDLGFPTINLKLEQPIESGIYASHVYVDNNEYIAATFVGEVKTFGENDYKLESYIMDFDQNIYGKNVKIVLHKKIRDNMKFDSVNDLIKQIKEDVSNIRTYFAHSKS